MDAELYTEHILKNTLLLFIRDKFTDGHRFQQDNDPKNTISSPTYCPDEALPTAAPGPISAATFYGAAASTP
ncbi:hypothetical protein P5673_021131 [Acropora cervicornis]|uniref:Uncharacterized protein n=1 Tax=Acropora cervicornis TaxID=6130 RepID=A0AAD9Q8Y0_ACRCE|nr:hypothetical protein P5673_021131 [Acropora cervicornis]